jgi:hypothetical protein
MLYDPKWTPPETEIKLEPWQRILLDAATIIEEKGWTRGSYTDGTGYCALGALRIASGMHVTQSYSTNQLRHNYPDYWKAAHVLSDNITSCGDTGIGIPCWNDSQSNKNAVIAKLRETAHAV